MQENKAVIFDMDGTMVDNMDFHIDAWLQFLDRRGKKMTKSSFLEVHHGTMREVVHRIFGEQFSPAEVDAMRREKESLYRSLYAPHITPIDGLREYLSYLQHQGIPIGLATAGDRDNINFTIDALELRPFFNVLIGAEEVEFGKPHPQAFLLAAEHLGISPDLCLVFEDSMPGIEAAKRAGMEVIGVTTMHADVEFHTVGVVRTIRNYHELNVR